MKLVARLPIAELRERPLTRVEYPPYDVCVTLVEGVPLAIEDSCNHAGASLAEGWLEEECIVCPVHQYAFHLRSGALVRPKGLCAPQRTFVVRQEGTDLVVYDPFKLVIVGT